MARPAATPEQRQHKRAEIRAAAAAISREQGVTGVTIRQVADRAGVSVGSVYRHFGSLGDLMRSLWAGPVAAANEQMALVAAAHADPLPRIRALLEEYVAFARDHDELYRGAFLFVRPRSAPEPEQRLLPELDFYRLLRDAVEAGQQEEVVVEGDADEITQLLWAGLHGVLALPVNIDTYRFLPAPRQAALMIDTLLAALTRERPDHAPPRVPRAR